MANSDGYDYSAMSPFIEEFQNPFQDRPFTTESEDKYGSLWQLKSCVTGWTMGVSGQKDHVRLLHKEANSPGYLPLNVLEKVILIEQLHGQYVLIGIQAVAPDGSEPQHVHSIVVKVGAEGAQFDIDGLLDNLRSSGQEDLAELLQSKYSPWTAADVNMESLRLNELLRCLTRFVLPSTIVPPPPRSGVAPVDASNVTASGSAGQASNTRSTARPSARAAPRVRSRIENEQPESSRKRRKSSAGAGSSGSGLTQVDNRGEGRVDVADDFDAHTATQKEFWEACKSSFIFGQQSYTVDISQCLPANDQYIIRKMEGEILKSVKKELVQMGDINQRQKICITPVDAEGKLLTAKPKDWNEIKNKKFMVINGQHSIAASKELQVDGCGEDRRRELEKWEAIVVWDLDPVRLTRISKFYNSTNHINHAQPTWGNQIVSCRNIWIANGRPTDKTVDAVARRNGAVQNVQKYLVSIIVAL